MPNTPDSDANDEDIDDDTVIYYADSLASVVDSLQDEII